MTFLVQDKGRRHVTGDKADFNLHADELHRDVIRDTVDGNRRIAPDLTVHPVQEALIQPFLALYCFCLASCFLITFKRSAPDSGMEHQVVLTDVIMEDIVKLIQGMDRIHVQAIDEPFFTASPESFDLLYEYSDKNVYTKDFFIRIFLRKRLDWPLLF